MNDIEQIYGIIFVIVFFLFYFVFLFALIKNAIENDEELNSFGDFVYLVLLGPAFLAFFPAAMWPLFLFMFLVIPIIALIGLLCGSHKR